MLAVSAGLNTSVATWSPVRCPSTKAVTLKLFGYEANSLSPPAVVVWFVRIVTSFVGTVASDTLQESLFEP